jgi:lysophospholipid hydrolase
VGGTSQGAFVGALLALYPDDPKAREKKARLFSISMGSIWGKLIDLTIPIVSYFSATQFNFGIRVVLGGDTRIQDLWLPFHCVSTDISYNREV